MNGGEVFPRPIGCFRAGVRALLLLAMISCAVGIYTTIVHTLNMDIDRVILWSRKSSQFKCQTMILSLTTVYVLELLRQLGVSIFFGRVGYIYQETSESFSKYINVNFTEQCHTWGALAPTERAVIESAAFHVYLVLGMLVFISFFAFIMLAMWEDSLRKEEENKEAKLGLLQDHNPADLHNK